MTVSRRLAVLASFMTLGFLIVPGVARSQNYRTCAWPIEVSAEGAGNLLGPEYLAKYWVMPFDAQDGTMTIKGTYPNARFFSFVGYNTMNGVTTEAAGRVYDAAIAPDPGTVNPFVRPGGANGTYTVVISRTGQNSGNSIKVDTDSAWVVLRLYVPSRDLSLLGQSLQGGVPLPTISLTKDGTTAELAPCSPVNKLADTTAFLQRVFPPGFDLIGEEGTPSPSDRLWFAAPTVPPPPLMPNPDNKYIIMLPGNEYQPGRIIVIHGKAPSTPDTYEGAPIWMPARGSRTVDMRFWSVCNNNFAIPIPVVACASDMTTVLEGGYYTIVLSDDLIRPDWLKPNVNWLPWGDERYFKLLFFRNLLPDPNFRFAIQRVVEANCTFDFTLPIIPAREDVAAAGSCTQQIMGDYYPVAAWCDQSKFLAGGWQACLDEHRGRRHD